MENQTIKYFACTISPSTSTRGEWICGEGEKIDEEEYRRGYPSEYESYELGVDDLPEGIEDIRGRIHYEPTRVFAINIDGKIIYEGFCAVVVDE